MHQKNNMNLRIIIKKIPLIGPMIVSVRRLLRRLILVPGWRRKAQIAYAQLAKSIPLNVSIYLPKIVRSEKAVIIQIGSNDGVSNDPVHELLLEREKWSAVFVEPVPYVFDRLKSNYPSSSRFVFENSLINDGSTQVFYWVSEEARKALPQLPGHWDQLGGFRRSHITNHEPELEPFILQAEIKGLTLDGLFKKHGIEDFDMIHTDTEGHDYAIISQLDLKKYQPKAILFERCHLTTHEELDVIRFLQEFYVLYYFDTDILAVEKETGNAIHDAMMPLRSLIIPRL